MNVNSLSNFIEKHIGSLGVKKNDNIVVHADITSFGIYHKKLLSIIIHSLMKKIGTYGTIAFPLYNTRFSLSFFDLDFSQKTQPGFFELSI